MIALYRSVSLVMIPLFALTSCKTRKDASSVASSDVQEANDRIPPEQFFEDQWNDLELKRIYAVKSMESELKTAEELEKIGDGAKQTAKISTSFAIVGVGAGGAAAGLFVLGYGSMTVGQAFTASLVYAKGIVAKYGYVKSISMFAATKVVQGLVSHAVLNYLTEDINSNINKKIEDDNKKIEDDWDQVLPKLLSVLAQIDTAINEVRAKSQAAAKTDTWLTYVKNSVTLGWYDVSYVRNIQQSHAVLADLYAQKAAAYGHLMNDLQERRRKIYGPKK